MSNLALDWQQQLQPGNEGVVGLAVSEATALKPVLPTWPWQQSASGRAEAFSSTTPCQVF